MQKIIPDSCCQFEITYDLIIRDHPTPTDISKNISKELVDVFLSTCTPIEKALFGRDKPLKGPDKLWIDPKDRCNAKLKLTPLKTDCLQALTHQGILEIGKQFEGKIEERNLIKIANAVEEAENFANFEANLKLKYHIDYLTKKQNEEWQNKFDEVVKKHEYDKNNLIESYEDTIRQLMSQEVQGKENPTELDNNAVIDTKEQMQNQINEPINNDLALQTVNYNEAMYKTLKNLEINDKNKLDKMQNECLRAMDVQSNLFNCKQMTVVMHVMAMEKQSFRIKLSQIQKKHDFEMKKMQEELKKQSKEKKSLNRLWNEFLIDIQQLQIEKFTDYEKKIYQQTNYLENQLNVLSDANANVNYKESLKSEQSQLIIIQENVNYHHGSGTDLAGNVNNCQQKAVNEANIEIIWQKNASDLELNYEKNFSNYIFQTPNIEYRETSDQIAHTATVIIDAVRNKKDEKTLKKIVINEIGGVFLKMSKINDYFDPRKSIDLVMPKTSSVVIKDSLDAFTKRVSILSDPVEQNQLVEAVDSFEILSQKPNLSNSLRNSVAAVEKTSDVIKRHFNKTPPYMAIPTNYKKMSDKDWENIEGLVDSKNQRNTTVQFDEENTICVNQISPLEHSRPRSRNSSILKQSFVQVEAPKAIEDDLEPIHNKCFEALKNLRVVSLLNLLSQDPDIQKQVE